MNGLSYRAAPPPRAPKPMGKRLTGGGAQESRLASTVSPHSFALPVARGSPLRPAGDRRGAAANGSRGARGSANGRWGRAAPGRGAAGRAGPRRDAARRRREGDGDGVRRGGTRAGCPAGGARGGRRRRAARHSPREVGDGRGAPQRRWAAAGPPLGSPRGAGARPGERREERLQVSAAPRAFPARSPPPRARSLPAAF